MKKILSLTLAIMFVFSSMFTLTSVASAADGLHFSLSNGACKQNEEFTISLKVENNPGLWSFYFILYYDADTFILRDSSLVGSFAENCELTDSKDNVLLEMETGKYSKELASYFPQYGVSLDNKSTKVLMVTTKNMDIEDFTDEGVAINLTFQTQGIAADGIHDIGLIPQIGSIINTVPEDIPFTWTNAKVQVGEAPKVPTETAPIISPETTKEVEETEKPKVETFVGEDGKTYFENDFGETVEYDPSVESQGENDVPDIEIITTGEAATGDDAADESGNNNNNEDGIDSSVDETDETTGSKNNKMLYFLLGGIGVLAAAAIVLVVIITKNKKKAEDLDNKDI